MDEDFTVRIVRRKLRALKLRNRMHTMRRVSELAIIARIEQNNGRIVREKIQAANRGAGISGI
jgi:hypothetical protein